jgi:RHS repeat-associated protein
MASEQPSPAVPLTYSVADHAREIRTRVAGIGERTEFEHGSGRERIVRRDYASDSPTVTTPVAITHYVGGAEVIRRFRDGCATTNSALTIRREIAGVVVLHELPLAATGCESAPPRLVRQLRLTDHLGSTDALLAFDGTAVSGAAGRQSFDAFGLRRDGSTWAALPVQARRTFDTSITRRGYTGHEQLDGAGLVHMNGRLYDPVLSRFIQADPIIQSPFDGQSLNRYTYVWNNPLAFTDPTGYIATPTQMVRFVAAATITYITGGMAAKAWSASVVKAFAIAGTGGAAAGYVQTGTLKGALSGAVTAMVFTGVGQWATTIGANTFERALMHGVSNGVLQELQGGSFGHGFVVAGVGKYLSATFVTGNVGVDGVLAILIGGGISKATGGDFVSGAMTAAMQFAFNYQGEVEQQRTEQQVFDGGFVPAADVQAASDRMSPEERQQFSETQARAFGQVALFAAGGAGGIVAGSLMRWLIARTAMSAVATSGTAPEVVIANLAQQHANSGVQGLAPYLSQSELALVLGGSRTSSLFLGTAVHRATAASLQARYPGQYIYFPNGKFDFLHTPTGQALELTTFGQAASHARRGADLVFYSLP